MKGIYIPSIILIFICMVLFPLLSMNKTVLPQQPDTSSSVSDKTEQPETLRVLVTETDKVTVMPAKDYVIGVVLAEMAAENEIEALKAQAVVAYTYALYKADLRKSEDYDVTDSSKTDQAFLSPEKAKERFQDNYSKYLEKITQAVESVENQVITYQGQPILASCHSISGGRTESAEVLWGGTYPYLKPVESAGDILSPKYLSEVTVSAEEMKTKLGTLNITLDGECDKWLTDFKRSDSGYVLNLKANGTEIKGSELRTALGLRSTNFDMTITDNNFKFTVRGYGHGVGLSQYGAQFMALQGSSYTDILNWYYTDCTIETH